MKYAISLFFLHMVLLRIKSTSRQGLTFVLILSSIFCTAQIPFAEIEGRLSIYLPDDTTSVHIGKNAGNNQDLLSNRFNTYIGTDAGRLGSLAQYNTFLGNNSGENSTGNFNTFVGANSGTVNTGSNNNFFGSTAGRSNDWGEANNFFGTSAGTNNESGSNNSFFGHHSGFTNNDGNSNSFFGSGSGFTNEQGSDNSFFGRNSGRQNDAGHRNSFFGSHAGENNNDHNNNSYFGYDSGRNAMGSHNTFLGKSTGYNGFGSYNVLIGSESGYDNQGDYNISIGREAGYTVTGSHNISIGKDVLNANTNAIQNVAIGSLAFSQGVNGGVYNTAVGDSSMYNADSGNPETVAQKNVALGAGSLFCKQGGEVFKSVAIGYQAGYEGASRSIFLGHQSGREATLRDQVLYIHNQSGDNPLIYGEFDNDLIRINGDLHSTGKVLLENNQNVIFKEADGITEQKVLSLDDNDHTILNAENDIIFNSGGTTAGAFRAMTIKADNKVGIGTQNPLWRTVVKEGANAITGGATIDISNLAMVFAKEGNVNNEGVGIGFQSSSDEENVGAAIVHERTGPSSQGKLHFASKTTTGTGDNIQVTMTISDDGKVGIGNINPITTLDVGGDINGAGLFCNYISACSDVRLKREFSSINNGLEKIMRLNGYYHFWNTKDYPEKNFTPKQQIGFKAQEVSAVLPEVVNTTPEGYLSVEYGKIVPLLVEAIKEQQAIIEKQQLQINQIWEAINSSASSN